MTHVDTNNMLSEEQFGFRHGHLTVYQLRKVKNLIKRSKANTKLSVMALVDGQNHKLSQYSFPIDLVKIICDYLDGGSSKVCVVSSTYPVRATCFTRAHLRSPTVQPVHVGYSSLPNDGTLQPFADDSVIC